jgi:hypothetical protein
VSVLFLTGVAGTLISQASTVFAQAPGLRFQVLKNGSCTTSVASGDFVNVKIFRDATSGTISSLSVKVNGAAVYTNPASITGSANNLEIAAPTLTSNPSTITVSGWNNNQSTTVNFTAYCQSSGVNYGNGWNVSTTTSGGGGGGGSTVGTTACTTTAWFQQGSSGTPSKMSYLDVSQPSASVTDSGTGFAAQLNGSGYNKSDSYFYGLTPDSSYGTAGTLWQFDSQGNTRNMGIALPKVTYSEGWFAGDIRGAGIPGQDDYLYVAQLNLNKIYKINLGPNVSNRVAGTITTSRNTRLNDIAFSPQDGKLYGFDQSQGVFVRIDPSTGTVTNISQVYPANAHGVSWFYQTTTGTAFYSYDNNGYIYRITGIESYSSGNLLPVQSYWKTATSTQQNDGSICATAATFCINPSTGAQYPAGSPDCTPVIDECPNIAGTQSSVPTGYVKNSAGDCVIPATPYLRAYGNDLAVGSAFGPSCNVRDSGATFQARARSTGTNTWAGASGQFALLALGPIDGFYSSNLRNPPSGPPSPRVGLTFGNFNGSSQVSDYGGTGGQTRCLPDFMSKAFAGEIQTSQTVGGQTINPGQRVAKFVRGDVYISGNIVFGNSGGWTAPSQIPSYYLVVEGNIYIAPGVTQLDGVYIAQPKFTAGAMDANTGQIRTCATSGGASYSTIADCNNTLTVNGAFIAHRVLFQRTKGDSNLASATEGLNDNTNVAEIFKFSPETYLAAPPANFQTGQSLKKYDFITSLPPVL